MQFACWTGWSCTLSGYVVAAGGMLWLFAIHHLFATSYVLIAVQAGALDRSTNFAVVLFKKSEAPMLKMFCFACSLATSTLAFGQAQPAAAKQMHMGAAETAIRSARTELNAALTQRDVEATARYWLPDVSTTGGDGSLWVGRDQNVNGFTKIFNGNSFVSGRRTPDKIEVATGGPKEAAETGIWQWRERVKSQVLTYGGRYLVMWQFVNGEWRIRSELYVTTSCSGGTGCL